MKKIIYLFLSLIILSCNSPSGKAIKIEDRPIIVAGAASELFSKISTAPQVFSINVTSDTSLICANGTVLSIPKNCFIDRNGNIVNENITIEIVEALSLGDFLRNNLQTLSGDQLLESKGMIYIDATANGQPLALQDNASLYVEMPSDTRATGYKIFTGKHDKQGNINWQENQAIDDLMIPLPLEELDLKLYTAFKYFKNEDGYEYMDSLVINDPKFENTYIATLEFEKRFDILQSFIYYDDYSWWRWEDFEINYDSIYRGDPKLVELYLNNIEKPLWYADSLVFRFLEEQSIQDSMKYMSSKYATKGDHVGWWRYHQWYREYIGNQRLTTTKIFDPRGVDMTQKNAKELLIKKGYLPNNAYQQIVLYNTRERIIKQRQEQKRLAEEQHEFQEKIKKAYSTAFNVNELGWINVDRFFNDPDAKEVSLFVQIISDSITYCDLTLLLPNRKMAINGVQMADGKYRFTKEAEMYRKLPVGDKAIIIAMSTKNEQPYFAMQSITIEEQLDLEIIIQPSNWEAIEEALANML